MIIITTSLLFYPREEVKNSDSVLAEVANEKSVNRVFINLEEVTS